MNDSKSELPAHFFLFLQHHLSFGKTMQHQDTKDRIQKIVFPVLDDLGFELVDIDVRGHRNDLVLTIFIDKEGGVNLDDCAEVSHEVGTLLDVEDVIPGSYRLEVSSPGLDRPLNKAGDYIRFAGKLIKLKTRIKCDPDQSGQERKTFRGKLLGLDGDLIRIDLEGSGGSTATIPLKDVEKANLELDF
jgi:ribosome maturation factor RimP